MRPIVRGEMVLEMFGDVVLGPLTPTGHGSRTISDCRWQRGRAAGDIR